MPHTSILSKDRRCTICFERADVIDLEDGLPYCGWHYCEDRSLTLGPTPSILHTQIFDNELKWMHEGLERPIAVKAAPLASTV